MRSAVLCLACAACWSAQVTKPAVEPRDRGVRTVKADLTGPPVSGVVRDAKTGAPLPDVVVEVFAPERKLVATSTNASGGYFFEHVPEGDHQIVFRHPTAGSTQLLLMVRERPVQLDAKLQ